MRSPPKPRVVGSQAVVPVYRSGPYELSAVTEQDTTTYAVSRGSIARGKGIQRFPAGDVGWESAWRCLTGLDRRIPGQTPEYIRLLSDAGPAQLPQGGPFPALAEAEAKFDWEQGRMVHIMRAELGGTIGGMLPGTSREREGHDVAMAIELVERVGWQLESSGYVYRPLRQRSPSADRLRRDDGRHRRSVHVPEVREAGGC